MARQLIDGKASSSHRMWQVRTTGAARQMAANGQVSKAKDCRCSTMLQIRIRINLESWIRIRVKGRIRIRIKVKSRIRIRIKVMRIRNTAVALFNFSFFLVVTVIGGFFRNQPVGEEIAGKSWYYGQISRGDCDTLMAERGQDGDFLVRDSESNVSLILF
jgi:hypothetical protein